MDNSRVIIAGDGDNAGRLVGRAILADDREALSEVSERIELGYDIVESWVEQNGGSMISGGGDEFSAEVPYEALDTIEELRNDYQFATNLTMTVGVGATLSEAGKSLLVGKFRGKNMVVIYDANIEKEIDQAQKNVEEGNASSEERKLSEAYLKPENGEAKPPEEQLMDLADADLQAPQIPKPDPKEEPKQEVYNIVETYNKNNHPEDDVNVPKKESANAEDRAIESNDQKAEDKHSEAAMRSIAQAIEGDEKPGQTEKDKLSHIDDEDMAVGDEMEGNTSRPEGYKEQNTPGDMGLSEDDESQDSPDLSSVLKDGLDSHADNMQREKVINMVSQALAGFKANKHILERAKDKAPELYNSCLSMLKAMIEMTKMLGLGEGQADQNPLADQAEQESEAPTEAETRPSDYQPENRDQEQAAAYGQPTVENDEQQDATHNEADGHDEDNCPYCQDPAEEEHSEDNCPYCQDPEEDCPHCEAMEEQAANKPDVTASPAAAPSEKKRPAAPSEESPDDPKGEGQ